jgi:hypothetical protein
VDKERFFRRESATGKQQEIYSSNTQASVASSIPSEELLRAMTILAMEGDAPEEKTLTQLFRRSSRSHLPRQAIVLTSSANHILLQKHLQVVLTGYSEFRSTLNETRIEHEKWLAVLPYGHISRQSKLITSPSFQENIVLSHVFI